MNKPYRKLPYDAERARITNDRRPFPRYLHVNPFPNRQERRKQAALLRKVKP